MDAAAEAMTVACQSSPRTADRGATAGLSTGRHVLRDRLRLTRGPLPRHGARVDQGLIVSSLRDSCLFERAQEDALAEIARQLRRRRFRRNETIFHQGDPGDALHIVSSGAVKIVLPSLEGEEAIIATLRSGDFFGELALLDGAPRSATAVAVEASETWTLSRELLLRMLDRDPALRDSLLAGVARELRRITGHVQELHFLDLAGRLASRLARLARETDADANEVRLDWPYTQSDLASMIGGTRQSVNKLLSGLVERGLVVIEKDTLLIPDVAALEFEARR